MVVMVVTWSNAVVGIASHLSTAARIFDTSLLPTTHLFEISRQTKWLFQSPSDMRSLEMGSGRQTQSRTLATHISQTLSTRRRRAQDGNAAEDGCQGQGEKILLVSKHRETSIFPCQKFSSSRRIDQTSHDGTIW